MNSQADLSSIVELRGLFCTWIKGKVIFNNLRVFFNYKSIFLGTGNPFWSARFDSRFVQAHLLLVVVLDAHKALYSHTVLKR